MSSPPILPEEDPTIRSLLRFLRRSFSSRINQCENARFVVAELPLDRREASAVLPLALKLDDPPTGTFFMVDYRKPAYSEPYLEAAMLVHVRTLLGPGMHCCWIVVDNDTPMIYGRETLAYPKKMAQMEFEETEDVVTAGVRRREIDLVRLEARKTQPIRDPAPVFGAVTYNVGGIGEMLGIQPIWRFRLQERFVEAHALEMNLTLTDSAFDPIARLIAGPPVSARFAVADIAGVQSILPIGLAGPRFLARTFYMRYR